MMMKILIAAELANILGIGVVVDMIEIESTTVYEGNRIETHFLYNSRSYIFKSRISHTNNIIPVSVSKQ